MKNRKNLFYVGLFIISGLGMTACGDDETYDVYGDPYNRVYALDKSQAYKIVQTPIGTVSNVDFTWEVKCSKKASGDIKVTVAVDNSLIDAYNEKHNTEFESIPVEALILENTEMIIAAGSMATVEPLHVKLTDDARLLSTLTSEKGYVIPLRLMSAEGGNSQLSTNMLNPSFLTVTVTEDNMNHEAVEYTGTGVLVQDQTGWSATTNGTVQRWYDPIETLFDNNFSSYCSISNRSGDLLLDVDMGQSYTFDGIKMTKSGYDYSTYEEKEEGAFSSGMKISTSDDGKTWKERGEMDRQSAVCSFYAPITAQYIRVTVPNAGGWYGASLECGVFNIYAK